MASLYEINEALEQAFENCIDPETGEIVGDTEVLDALEMERDQKIENIACFIKNLKAEAEAIRAEEKALADRRKAAENKAERLKEYLANNLNGEKFKSPRVAVSWRRSESVVVPDVFQLPDEYVRYKDPEPNRTLIKEAIKKGFTVEGAELVENTNLIIK